MRVSTKQVITDGLEALTVWFGVEIIISGKNKGKSCTQLHIRTAIYLFAFLKMGELKELLYIVSLQRLLSPIHLINLV